jgi:hypothetical protein
MGRNSVQRRVPMGVSTTISFKDNVITAGSHAHAMPVRLASPDEKRVHMRSSVRNYDCASLYQEEFFNDFLRVERKKAERSRRPFLLMLIDLENLDPHEKGEVVKQVTSALFSTSRETDVKGWYKRPSVIGIIFTERNPDNNMACFKGMIFDKVCGGIKNVIGSGRFRKLDIGLHVLPQNLVKVSSGVNKDEREPLGWALEGSQR